MCFQHFCFTMQHRSVSRDQTLIMSCCQFFMGADCLWSLSGLLGIEQHWEQAALVSSGRDLPHLLRFFRQFVSISPVQLCNSLCLLTAQNRSVHIWHWTLHRTFGYPVITTICLWASGSCNSRKQLAAFQGKRLCKYQLINLEWLHWFSVLPGSCLPEIWHRAENIQFKFAFKQSI